ncbi:MAG: M20/M25/M40 family metallo-hydrolase, partial [Rhizobacter sp.]|nr:M20/M25/M40 family metallo-hydrolase [Chlorobiales bacterium]
KGKIVVMMRFSPDGNNPHSDFYDYAALRYKINTARDNGATGVLIFTGKENDEDDKLVKLSSENLSTDAGIPVLNVSRPLAAVVLRKSEAELAAIQKSMDQSKSPKSFVVKNSIVFEAEVIKERKPTQNVIAYLEGSDAKLKDEFVVIGGHYDHLGYGGNGSGSLAPDQKKIHYGADDNASGTAGVLEAARYFAAHPNALKRSVIFMCFSGEEMGLLGSAYFTAHPAVPLEKITAMLNMDMIGRMKDSLLSIGGAGTAQGLRDRCNALNMQGFKLKLTDDGYGPSDHASFYVKDIPVLFFFTGNHANYHKPTDTWDKINSAGEASVVNYVCALAAEFASGTERLTFTKAKSNSSSASMASGGGFRVSLGTIPNYAEEVEGVKLDGVREGSVAEKSGIKGGDIIIGFGAQTIRSIYDYTDAIRAARPGDEVKITVLRGKEKLELIARFPDKAAANVRQ